MEKYLNMKETKLHENMRIVEKLSLYLSRNQGVNFCKALQELGINRKEELMGLVDTENESSLETLKRINGNEK